VKILELGGCGTYEVSHIGKMKGVEKLVLWRGTRLIDPSFLVEMKSLRFLEIVEPVNEATAAVLQSLPDVTFHAAGIPTLTQSD